MPLRLRDGAATLLLDSERTVAATSWCQASVPLVLRADELAALATGLRSLTEAGFGSFLWTNEGGEVRIEVVMGKRGETHWSIRLQSPPDYLHELRLVFVGRQDELPAIADDVAETSGRFSGVQG